jgi:hypothetical protein
MQMGHNVPKKLAFKAFNEKQNINPSPSLMLQSACDLNVPCRPKRFKVLLLSYTFKCPLKKKRSLSAHAVGL